MKDFENTFFMSLCWPLNLNFELLGTQQNKEGHRKHNSTFVRYVVCFYFIPVTILIFFSICFKSGKWKEKLQHSEEKSSFFFFFALWPFLTHRKEWGPFSILYLIHVIRAIRKKINKMYLIKKKEKKLNPLQRQKTSQTG